MPIKPAVLNSKSTKFFYQVLGSRIKEIREEESLTSDELSAMLKDVFSGSQLRKLELGLIRCKVHELIAVADRLDRPVTTFLQSR